MRTSHCQTSRKYEKGTLAYSVEPAQTSQNADFLLKRKNILTVWRLKETPHQKRCVTCYMNIVWSILIFICVWKFGSIFKKISNVFAKVFESCFTNKESSKYHEWKLSRRNNDNDVGTFVMLKYERNENTRFCVFIGHERQKLFWGIFIPIIKCFCCDFLANVLKKGLFLTSTTQTLPIFNSGNCSFYDFFCLFFFIFGQDQDSLLVKGRNDNHSPGPVIRELVPSSHQRSELTNTILCIFSR